MKITNQFMNDFEIHVTDFEPVFNDYQYCGAIKFIITTLHGTNEFLEWVNFDDFNDCWRLEKIDSHLHANEMEKIYNLFKLKDKTVACVRDHHYPIEEIQEYLQSWLDKNTSSNAK